MTEVAAGRRSKMVVGGAVVLIVVVGTIIGLIAVNLARRAPRAAGMRVAVVNVEGAPWANDAVARLLSSTPGVSIVPRAEVRARWRVMTGKQPGATIDDAADALDLDALVGGEITKLTARGRIVAEARGDDVEHATHALAAMLSHDQSAAAPVQLPTKNLDAYAAFANAENARDDGRFPEAFEQALLAFRLDKTCGPCALLVVELSELDAGSAFDPSEAMRAVDDRTLSDRDRLMAQGFRALLVKNVEGALDAFRRMSVEFPEDAAPHFWLGRIYNRDVGAHDEALRHLENAKRLVPDQRVVYDEIADAWVKLGERANALGVMKAYLKMFPDDAEAKRERDAIEAGMSTKPTMVQ